MKSIKYYLVSRSMVRERFSIVRCWLSTSGKRRFASSDGCSLVAGVDVFSISPLPVRSHSAEILNDSALAILKRTSYEGLFCLLPIIVFIVGCLIPVARQNAETFPFESDSINIFIRSCIVIVK